MMSFSKTTTGVLAMAGEMFLATAMAWGQPEWHFETIETGFGGDTSIALDSHDRPHISYYYHNTGDLKYAVRQDDGWVIQTVDGAGRTGLFTSLALDEFDRPRIAYRDFSSGRAVFAEHTGTTWIFSTIKSGGQAQNIDLALDSAGSPHVAFYDLSDRQVYYASQFQSQWTLTGVAGSQLFYTSISINSMDYPSIGAGGGGGGGIIFAEFDGDAWTVTRVTDDTFDSFSSLEMGANDTPYLAFLKSSPLALSLGVRMTDTWEIETVEPGVNGANGGVTNRSLALDPNGRPHIIYRDLASGELRFARRTDTGWDIQVLEVGATEPSLAFDSKGRPHIFYQAGGEGGLFRYGYQTICVEDDDCQDNNPCTDDVCNGAGECEHPNDDTNECDDGAFCNGEEHCSSGECTSPGDPCIGGGECNEVCNEANDNCFELAGPACGDGPAECSDQDTCDGVGNCAVNDLPAGTVCTDDGNPCTDDLCDGAGTCEHTVPAG